VTPSIMTSLPSASMAVFASRLAVSAQDMTQRRVVTFWPPRAAGAMLGAFICRLRLS
jgi:hypothetical protein